MNTVSLPDEVHIEGTGNDAGVPGMLLMQTDEIAAVEGQHGPLLRSGESQNSRVGNRLAGVTTNDSRDGGRPRWFKSLA